MTSPGGNEINVKVTATNDTAQAVEEAKKSYDELKAKMEERIAMRANATQMEETLAKIEGILEVVDRQIEDPKQFKLDVGDAEAKLAALTAEIAALDKLISDLRSKNIIDGSRIQQVEAMRTAAAALRSALDDAKTAESEAAAEAEKLGTASADTAVKVERVGSSAKGVGAGANEAKSAMRDLGDETEKAGNKAGSSVGRFALFNPLMTTLLATLPAAAAAFAGLGEAAVAAGAAFVVIKMGMPGIQDALKGFEVQMQSIKASVSNEFAHDLSAPFLELGKNMQVLKPQFREVAGAISDFIANILPAKDDIQKLGDVLDGVAQFFEHFKAGAADGMDALSQIGQAAANAAGKIGDGFTEAARDFQKMIQTMKNDGTLDQLFASAGPAIKAFGDALTAVIDVLMRMGAAAGPQMSQALEHLASALGNAAPAIASFAKGLASVIDAVATVIDWLTKLYDKLGPVGQAFTQLVGFLLGASFVFGKIESAISGIVGAFSKFIRGATDAGNSAKGMGDSAGKAAGDIGKVSDSAGKAGQAASQLARGAADAHPALDKTGTSAKSAAAGADNLASSGQKAADQGLAKITAEAPRAAGGIGDLLRVLGGVGTAVSAAIAVFQGFSQNMDDMSQHSKQAVDDMVAGAAAALEGNWAEAWQKAVQVVKDAAALILDVIKSIAQAFQNFLGGATPGNMPGATFSPLGGAVGTAFATGGIASGGLTLVGEDGPELVHMPAGAKIQPGTDMPSSMKDGGGSGSAPQQMVLQISGGSDSALGTLIANLARSGKLKISSRAIVN